MTGSTVTTPATGMETPSFFKLKVKPGEEDEYVRRHQNVWPQVTRDLEMAGVEVNLCTKVIIFFLNDVHKMIVLDKHGNSGTTHVQSV